MDVSRLNYDEMLSLSSQLLTLGHEMESLLNEVTGDFDRTEEVWSGQAGDTVRTKFREVSNQFPPFIETIEECSQKIKKSVEAFEETDRKIEQIN